MRQPLCCVVLCGVRPGGVWGEGRGLWHGLWCRGREKPRPQGRTEMYLLSSHFLGWGADVGSNTPPPPRTPPQLSDGAKLSIG